jgi:hypothetical protein
VHGARPTAAVVKVSIPEDDHDREFVARRWASVTECHSRLATIHDVWSEDAFTLLSGALKAYREEHKHAPARMVLHKRCCYYAAELDGFNRLVDSQHLETADFLVVGRAFTRLFSPGVYPR